MLVKLYQFAPNLNHKQVMLLDIKCHQNIIPNTFSQIFNKMFEILQILKIFKKKKKDYSMNIFLYVLKHVCNLVSDANCFHRTLKSFQMHIL